MADQNDLQGMIAEAAPEPETRGKRGLIESLQLQYGPILDVLGDAALAHLAGKIFFSNHAALGLFDVEKTSSLVGRSPDEFVHPDDISDIGGWRLQSASSRQRRPFKPYRFLTGSGAEFQGEISTIPIEIGGVTAFLDIIRAAGSGDTPSRAELEASVRERTQQLEITQQRFRDFAESSADQFWESDAEHRFTFASSSDHSLLPDVVGKTRWELAIEGDDLSLWRSHREDLDSHRPFRDFAYAVKDRDGEIRNMKVSGKPVFDDAGIFVGYRGSAVDVTAAVHARRDIADIRSKFSTALENITEGLAVWDSEDQFVYCNSFFRYVHPWAAATLLPGASIEAFVRGSVKGEWGSKSGLDENDWVERRLGNFRAAGTTQVDSLDGKWIQIRTEKLQDGSTVALLSDITDQKRREEALRESEERFRKSFEDAAIGMAIVGVEGQFRLVNRAFSEMVGYSASELIAKKIADITHPEDVEASNDVRNKILKGERSDHPQEKRYLHKDGRVIWVSLTRALIRGADGQNLYTIGQVQDITEYKESEDRLRQALKMEAVGQLTGGVAHDFNNLLASIIGNLELIGNKIEDDAVLRRRVDRAMRSAKAGGVLTNRLLAFSRRQNLEPCQTSLGDLVENMLDILMHSVTEAIQIKTEFASDLLPTLVDQNQLENALLNLAINARDAMPDGGQLLFSGTNTYIERCYSRYFGRIEAGDYVKLLVRDTGTGMTQEVLDHLFEPFFTTKGIGEGSGLGLSMVFGFIKQSGGHIDIESELGVGTAFMLYLPVANGEIRDTVTAPPGPNDVPKGQGQKVLLVEDDESVRDATAEMLEHLGYAVVDGGAGGEAIEMLDSSPDVELILTDVVLSDGRSGPAIAQEAVERRPDLGVLMMTGYAEQDVLLGKGNKSVFPLLKKPFQIGELGRELNSVLESRLTKN